MEANLMHDDPEDDEEYVFLDFESVSEQFDIPPTAPYVLSGLDTLNPIMVIDNKLKLIGHYEETIGTCITFTEESTSPAVHDETGPSEASSFSGEGPVDTTRRPSKQVKPLASINKILKFRLLVDKDKEDASTPAVKKSVAD